MQNLENKNTEIQNSNERKITKKSRSNFLFSFSFLNKEKNEALNTVYAYCRKTDDIADDNEVNTDEKLIQLKKWRDSLERSLNDEETANPLMNNLNKVIKKFNIPEEPFYDLIEGMEIDLKKNRFRTFAELADYCYKAASNVGLMCIEIFGYKNPETKNFAINLGIALQLTNILRDIKADAERGRIYIPQEDLRRFNYKESDLLEGRYNEDFIKLMKFECGRAKYFYKEADKSLSDEDRGSMFAARIMEQIYLRILRKIERKNYNVFEKKVSISDLRKAMISLGVYLKYRIFYAVDGKGLAIQNK